MTELADWTESLKTLDVGTLRPVFNELAGLEKDAGRHFGPTLRHTTRTAKAIRKDARLRQTPSKTSTSFPSRAP